MTSTFRTAGAWGGGVGRPLTWVEQDNNTYDKETRITSIEAAGVAVGIDHIVVSGDQMFIHMTDSSVQGPFTLPSAEPWNFVGEWQPSSLYHVNDVITFGGSAYLVLLDHTSTTTFDPNETGGTGGSDPLYQLMWSYAPNPGIEIPDSIFTPDLEHANNYIRLTNSGGCVVTFDPSIDFPAWTEIHFRDCSSDTGAACTFEVPTPGSINPVSHRVFSTDGFGSVVTMKQVSDTGVWDIFGHLLFVA